ncbi:MAG TPA: thermonuclease family protein [Candidatus Binatia bacterium]|nr:thermonuclease family protein [Candidatus Binatia bacterium]
MIRPSQLILAAPLVLVAALALSPAHVVMAQPAAGQEAGVPGPRIVLGTDPKTGQRYIQLAGQSTPAYPTIDLLCDGKRWTVALTRSEGGLIYEPLRSVTETMLAAVDCRMFLPDQEITLARAQLWAAWAIHSRGSEAPAILVGQVLDVVDGNTIRVNLGDRVETVRYIGINAKTTQAVKGQSQSGADVADANRQLVARQQVRLELDAQERDRDGRLLAYVFVADRMVNAELVRRGSAETMTIQPNVRYRDLFVTLEQEARDDRRGLWADQSEPTTPTTLAQATSPGAKERLGVPPESAWACPAAQPIKGLFNAFSSPRCVFHVLDSELYGATKPDRCYATVDDARQDGCQAARR